MDAWCDMPLSRATGQPCHRTRGRASERYLLSKLSDVGGRCGGRKVGSALSPLPRRNHHLRNCLSDRDWALASTDRSGSEKTQVVESGMPVALGHQEIMKEHGRSHEENGRRGFHVVSVPRHVGGLTNCL